MSEDPLPMMPTMVGTATLSEDTDYCYLLTRRWHPHGIPAVFVMLHPTLTADGATDDATVRRCVRLAASWGCTAAHLVNLYGLRSASRAAFASATLGGIDPVGPENDTWLARQFYIAKMIDAPLVAAWGTHARTDRVTAALGLPGAERLTCLGMNADGSPVHPSHAEPGTPLTPWAPPRTETTP